MLLLTTLLTTFNKCYNNKKGGVNMTNKIIVREELERLRKIEEKQKKRYKEQNLRAKELYDRISLTVPKGKKELLEQEAKKNDKTLNKFISEMLLSNVVINDFNNVVNNNSNNDNDSFIIPSELKTKISVFTDNISGYILTAILEKLKLDEQFLVVEKEPITESAEEMPQEQEQCKVEEKIRQESIEKENSSL